MEVNENTVKQLGCLHGCTSHTGQLLPTHVCVRQRNAFHRLHWVTLCAQQGASSSRCMRAWGQAGPHAHPPHPVHGEVDPQGVMQLVQELDKALFLRRQRKRRMDESGTLKSSVTAKDGCHTG